MVNWSKGDLAKTLGIPAEKVRLSSPFIGGGFGGKLFVRSDALMAALAARAAGRPVKIALQRDLMFNNTTHRAATIQRIRVGATKRGNITAIAHESWSGDLPGGSPETAVQQTRQLYAGANRMTAMRLAVLDLPEASAMRAPGEASGMMALEIAMDEMAEKLGLDPIQFRILNDTQLVPDNPGKPDSKDPQSKKDENSEGGADRPPLPFSQRQLVACLLMGAERFGWSKRKAKPAQVRDGRWLIGLGVAAAFRNNLLTKSAARVRLDNRGVVTVETDMTDIGTGSYTIIAQTAAEMMGVPLDQVIVKLGDTTFPVSCGSGGQWGGNNSTAGVYAACVKLREAVARQWDLDPVTAVFADGQVRSGSRSFMLAQAAAKGELTAEDHIEYGGLDKKYHQSTFGAHFVEVAVDSATGETRVRRTLSVCAAGRILNPKSARSQVIGAMTMGVGAALMEGLVVDKRIGYFVNHDLATYEVPVHADIPHQEVIFLDETDPMSSPMKAKGVGELGICGAAAAVANAIYNATGVRVRDYPITLDKLIDHLPEVAA
jgi:xanthine dehydrogenase YagR molybdenum-binding subunit